MEQKLNIGLIINPVAGIGGRVALKGSDGEDIQQQALSLGAVPEADKRTRLALQQLLPYKDQIHFHTVKGKMGEELLDELGFVFSLCHTPKRLKHTTESDTENAAKLMVQTGVDILLFAGGDGTAKNVLEAVGENQLCLGIPAGCKIYSAVFSVTPELAGDLVAKILSGELVDMRLAEVLDINEQEYRHGKIRTRVFGEMLVPADGSYVQSVKVSGRENDSLVYHEIAAWVVENMEASTLYLIGSGKSTLAIKDELGFEGSLLGVDVFLGEECILKDATEQQILDVMAEHQSNKVQLILSPIGGQGILLGRGNHQICHKVIKRLDKENIMIIASKSKITQLQSQPLRIDTGDTVVNEKLSGYFPVLTGYDDQIIYPVRNN